MSNPTIQTQIVFGTLTIEEDWQDVSEFVRGIPNINRGRTNPLEPFQPGTCSVLLDNSDRRFDPTFDEVGGLVLDGTASNYASTPDHASLDITGDIDIRVKVAMTTWTPAIHHSVLGKWSNTGNQRSYLIQVTPLGRLLFYASSDGIAAPSVTSSVAIPGVAAGVGRWLRVTRVQATGVTTFYTSDDYNWRTEMGTWTAFGTAPILSAGLAIFNSTATMRAGSHDGGWMSGRVFQAQVRNGIGGTVVANPDFTAHPDGTPSFTDSTGKVWTLTGSVARLVFGAPYYPNVLPMRWIRIRAVHNSITYPLFEGFIDAWPWSWNVGLGWVEVTATDAFKVFSHTSLQHPVTYHTTYPETVTAYYQMNEEDGSSTAVDYMGDHHGTYGGNPTFGQSDPITDDIDGAVLFDGVNGRIELPFTMNASRMVVRGWVKVASVPASGNAFLFYQNQSARDLAIILKPSGYVQAYDSLGPAGANSVSSTTTINDGNWHDITVEFGPTVINIFIDTEIRTDAPFAEIGINIFGSGAAQGTRLFGPIVATATAKFANVYATDWVFYPGAMANALTNAYDARLAWAGEVSSLRIYRVLAQARWNSLKQELDTGNSYVQSASDIEGANLLEYLQLVAASEDGALYMKADGDVKFRARHALLKAPYTVSQATFGDDGTELPYSNPVLSYDDSQIANVVTVSRRNGTPQTVRDEASITAYQPRGFSRDGLLLQSDGETRDAADWILAHHAQPQPRIEEITLEPYKENSDPLWVQVLSRELEDRVTVKARPPGGGNVFSKEVHIQQITHSIGPDSWETTLTLSPSDTQSYWVWGTSTWDTSTRWAS